MRWIQHTRHVTLKNLSSDEWLKLDSGDESDLGRRNYTKLSCKKSQTSEAEI